MRWAFFGFGTIGFSILGVVFPNFFKDLSKPRAHNEIKLFNECLARHQFGYFAYFSALSIGAHLSGWLYYFNWSATCLALGFYGYGLYSSAKLESRIAHAHGCPQDSACSTPLGSKRTRELSRLNIVFAVVMLLVAFAVTILLPRSDQPVKSAENLHSTVTTAHIIQQPPIPVAIPRAHQNADK